MIKRRRTKTVSVGSVNIGSSGNIVIQSMTKVATSEVAKTVKQVKILAAAGAELVRIAVPTHKDALAFAEIAEKSPIPLIADIHFSPALAIKTIEAGAAKVRLNPGNIKKKSSLNKIIDSAKMHKTAIRIGINEASIRDLRKKDIPIKKRISLMHREIKLYVKIFENRGFDRLILSAKSSDPIRTIQINRRIAAEFEYPIHLGLTHAGLQEDAIVSSAVTMGILLSEGIGDTIRISIAGDPVKEVEIARKILVSLGLIKNAAPELIVCPVCSRAEGDVLKTAGRVKKLLKTVNKPVRVAVMGCIVNGPGEAADAKLAVCMAKNRAWIFLNGKRVSIIPAGKIVSAVKNELIKIRENNA